MATWDSTLERRTAMPRLKERLSGLRVRPRVVDLAWIGVVLLVLAIAWRGGDSSAESADFGDKVKQVFGSHVAPPGTGTARL